MATVFIRQEILLWERLGCNVDSRWDGSFGGRVNGTKKIPCQILALATESPAHSEVTDHIE